MKSEKEVVKWLQRGYPYLKEESGLPTWLVSEHSFARITDELADERILETCRPLRFTEGLKELIDQAPDPDEVPAEMWQIAIKLWPAYPQVKPMVDICLDCAGGILRQFQSGRLKMDPVVVCRGMAVLGYAPFVPRGRRLTEEVAALLGGDVNEPAMLVKRYAEAVTSGDGEMVNRVDDCIAKYSCWVQWARMFLQQLRDFPYTVKPVGVTPPVSAEIIGVLAQMMKEEGQDDEPGRYYPEHPES